MTTTDRGAGSHPITACPLDCPDTCSLPVTVEDDRLVGIDAVPDGERATP